MSDRFKDLLSSLNEAEQTGAVNSLDLGAALMRQFGGADGVAEVMKNLHDQSDSDAVRARVATAVLDLAVANTKIDSANEIAGLTDEDLETELKLLLKAMVKSDPVFARELLAEADPPAAAV